jgi:hypothetical protein
MRRATNHRVIVTSVIVLAVVMSGCGSSEHGSDPRGSSSHSEYAIGVAGGSAIELDASARLDAQVIYPGPDAGPGSDAGSGADAGLDASVGLDAQVIDAGPDAGPTDAATDACIGDACIVSCEPDPTVEPDYEWPPTDAAIDVETDAAIAWHCETTDGAAQDASCASEHDAEEADEDGGKPKAPALVAEEALDCPNACSTGKCKFKLELAGKAAKDPADGTKQLIGKGATLCQTHEPGEITPPPKDPKCDKCQSDLDRPVDPKKNNFTITLLDGTECKFTADVFPGNRPWPPDWTKLPAKCKDVIKGGGKPGAPKGISQGGCYETLVDVRAISTDFGLVTYCFCNAAGGKAGGNKGMITLQTALP